MKGAPEMVEKYLSTIPSCYESLYKQYTLQGKRVISLAWKDLPESVRSLMYRIIELILYK